jgi:anti-anti-sigma regulatory factor
MNEQENDTRTGEHGGNLAALEAAGVAVPRKEGDLVVDLTGIRELDLINLSLLLTAQRNAEEEDREVWLAGVPRKVWQALDAMGLGGFFRPFPVSTEVAD